MNKHGSNYITLRKAIEDFKIDLTKINQNRNNLHKQTLNESRKKIPLEDILSGKHQKEYHSNTLKERLIKAGYKEHKCERCGLTEWLGQPIPLNLHHKDGNHCNNMLENIEFLCPNCHALTDNFAGKNVNHTKRIKPTDEKRITKKGISEDGTKYYDGYGNYKILCPVCKENFMNKTANMCRSCYDKERKKPKISREELYDAIDRTNNYNEVARMYGYDKDTIFQWHKYYAEQDRKNGIQTIASENAPPREVLKKEIREYVFEEIGQIHGDVDSNTVKKWCVRYGLPHLKSEIKKYSDEDWVKL